MNSPRIQLMLLIKMAANEDIQSDPVDVYSNRSRGQWDTAKDPRITPPITPSLSLRANALELVLDLIIASVKLLSVWAQLHPTWRRTTRSQRPVLSTPLVNQFFSAKIDSDLLRNEYMAYETGQIEQRRYLAWINL
ncbi:hypothetical protein EGR_08962 [Echinococcus granulosus]|uniref:Uncharacterized protein n=1 Tax=Echinococcus granulosus TaxID=6210 RepID=W6UCY3_ECHGR|nr:hypothetical protein EGR_08962 [Echinococcus granulosus]EUB56157.1 hypothetical protein EGR_08962 [Echinococcus granulosus]